jgi:hypothetical protein
VTNIKLSDMDSMALPSAGESLSIEIPWRETRGLVYFDLLFSCLVAERTKTAVRWTSFEVEGDACFIRGTVTNKEPLAAAVSELQALRYAGDSSTKVADEMQNLAFEMEDKWLSETVALPELFKTTRVEQLLYFMQNEELDREQMRSCALELVKIDSRCSDLPIVKESL